MWLFDLHLTSSLLDFVIAMAIIWLGLAGFVMGVRFLDKLLHRNKD